MILKAAIDSNVLYSAITNPRGEARKLLVLAEELRIKIGIPKYCLIELEPIFIDIGSRDLYLELMAWVRDNAEEIVHPRGKVLNSFKIYCNDIWDVPVIASAILWKAEYFVTGNLKDFNREKVEQHLKIVTIKEFISMF